MPSISFLRALTAVASIFVVASAADCTREGLFAAAQSYIDAQIAGKTSDLKLSPTFKYQQNNKERAISAGLLATPYKLDLVRSTADTVACASYTMWISSSGSKPYVVGTQIRHDNNDTSTISLIDTIAATTGDLFFNAPKTLGYIQKRRLDPNQQHRIETVERAFEESWRRSVYESLWEVATAWRKLEAERDEEVQGSVDVLCQFDSLGTMPDSHEIRVIDGKVKYVHTITALKVG
ncbi:H/ACA snoRNP pseudouridylase subunit [Kalmusia sp. IMI 367209]|nr:H/ACA snoRNP pseudouridylase subunit [Kalmusia sp. IMI 367209]